jgi:predicted negative regulator of RcsB-dependent stress response
MSVFWYRFRKEIVVGFVILLFAAAAWGAFRFYSQQRDSNAAAQLATAKSSQDYEKIISEFGRTPAGASACLLLAGKQRSEGKFAEANTTLQNFIDKHPQHELVPAAKVAMAANLESLKKNDEALALYQQIAATYPRSFTAPLALISQVTLLKQKNQPDAARRVCETILSQYGESFWAGEAQRELQMLKPAGAAVTPEKTNPVGVPVRPQPAPSTAAKAPSPK